MTAFLIRSELTRNDLRLFLSNTEGYPTDAFSVRWTVYNRAGTQISGKSLPAIRATVGEFYAPWSADNASVRNNNYEVLWEIQAESGGPIQYALEKFFVVDPASYRVCTIHAADIPALGGFVYLTGTALGRGDLPLYLKNNDGVPTDAYAVFWTICNLAGCPITSRTAASHPATGEYFVSWTTYACTGNYTIKWEWMADATSPLQSKSMGFSVINSSIPYIYHGTMPKLVTCCTTAYCCNPPYMNTCTTCTTCTYVPMPCPCDPCYSYFPCYPC